MTKILRDLSQQSGVALTIVGGAPEGALVTGRIHETSLSEAMSAIAALYAAQWEKTGDISYELRPNGKSTIENKLEQLGDLYWYHFYQKQGGNPEHPNMNVPERVYWASIIGPSVPDPKQLTLNRKNTVGVPVSLLPEDVQDQMIDALQTTAALKIAEVFRAATLGNLKQATLVIDAKPPIVKGAVEGAATPSFGNVWVEAPGYGKLDFDIKTLLASVKPPAEQVPVNAPPAQ